MALAAGVVLLDSFSSSIGFLMVRSHFSLSEKILVSVAAAKGFQ